MATRAEINTILAEDRMRISAILESPEGLKNQRMARELALRQSLDARAAIELLRTAPAENPFVEAMASQGPVGIAPPSTVSGIFDPKERKSAEIAASMQAFNVSRHYASRN